MYDKGKLKEFFPFMPWFEKVHLASAVVSGVIAFVLACIYIGNTNNQLTYIRILITVAFLFVTLLFSWAVLTFKWLSEQSKIEAVFNSKRKAKRYVTEHIILFVLHFYSGLAVVILAGIWWIWFS
jgi:hypothetical protein